METTVANHRKRKIEGPPEKAESQQEKKTKLKEDLIKESELLETDSFVYGGKMKKFSHRNDI